MLSGDYKIEDDSGDSDDETDEKKQAMNVHVEVDFKYVESRLNVVGFNAKKDLPVLVKRFQFQRFGFKNKSDYKLLIGKTRQLVEKYARIKEKNQRKNKRMIMLIQKVWLETQTNEFLREKKRNENVYVISVCVFLLLAI